MGSQNILSQVLDTMLLDIFPFFSKCQKNRKNKILELFKIILVQIYGNLYKLLKYIFLFSIYLSLLLFSFFFRHKQNNLGVKIK